MSWSELKQGSKGAEVGNWQRFLNEQRYVDWNSNPLVIDEVFGPKSSYATKKWQVQNQIVATGTLTLPTRIKSQRALRSTVGFIPFIQAARCKVLYPNARKSIDVITIHTMESAEKPGTAENVSRWFAGSSSPIASAHYCVDPENVIQCVRDSDVAWHAPGCNHNGIGIEHAGYAKQNDIDWADESSVKILILSAKLTARLVKTYTLPVIRLTPDELKKGKRGLCGHIDATIAFPGPGRTHSDPGKNFPWSTYLDLIDQFVE